MALYVNGHKVAPVVRVGATSLKDISPITKNGTYNAGANLTVLNSITLTGNAYVATDISIPNSCNWDIEAKFKVTQVLSSTDKSALFGSKGSSSQVLFNQTSNSFFLYMYSEYAYSTAPQVGTEYVLVKNGDVATINGVTTTKGREIGVVGTNSLDLFAYNEGDGTHSRKFVGEFNYLKFVDNGSPIHWFIPVKNTNNELFIYDKVTCLLYSVTGTGATAGSTSGETLCGGFASPLVVSVPSLTKWGVSPDNFFRTSEKSTPDLEDLVVPNGECPKTLGYVFQYSGLKSITINDSSGNNFGTTANGSQYAFRNNPNIQSVLIDCGSRTNSFGQTACTYAFMINSLGVPSANPPATFEFRVDTINGASAFSYMFQNNLNFKYFAFPNLQKIGISTATCFTNTFYNTNQCYMQSTASINHFRFPVLNQIGGNSSSYNGAFKAAFTSGQSSTYHYGQLILPELAIAYAKSSTTSNGHFANCNALNKVYLPKFNNCGTGTTYSKYMFYSCTNLTEIHFGIENSATVQAMDGYATNFGATNATLYFDMPNHITVNGSVYDRDGEHYDYDNSYYSWKNGSNIIYTTNAIDPAVGDTTYTKSGSTYTAGSTITAIS